MELLSEPMPVVFDGRCNTKNYLQIDWFAKIIEETHEAMTAENRDHLAEELVDIITVCTSFLESLGYDRDARAKIFLDINAKNARRGYFEQ